MITYLFAESSLALDGNGRTLDENIFMLVEISGTLIENTIIFGGNNLRPLIIIRQNQHVSRLRLDMFGRK